MIIALYSLLPILAALILGLNVKKVIPAVNIKFINIISEGCLYSLLVLMGITIGLIPDIKDKLILAGINAISIAVAASLCITIVLRFFHLKNCTQENLAIKRLHQHSKSTFNIINYIKDPILLAGLVITGFYFGYHYFHFLADINYDLIISSLLYLLIFAIAVKLSFSGLNLKQVFFNQHNIVMTLATVLASYLGAAIASLFLTLTFTQSLAVSSGFGWYTLSGILFTKMGDPLLGSVAFLCDLFREAIALILIPALSGTGNGRIAIGVAGATAMDVTLPVIEKHYGVAWVPVALLSGGIITLLVPFLISFFYALQ